MSPDDVCLVGDGGKKRTLGATKVIDRRKGTRGLQGALDICRNMGDKQG